MPEVNTTCHNTTIPTPQPNKAQTLIDETITDLTNMLQGEYQHSPELAADRIDARLAQLHNDLRKENISEIPQMLQNSDEFIDFYRANRIQPFLESDTETPDKNKTNGMSSGCAIAIVAVIIIGEIGRASCRERV